MQQVAIAALVVVMMVAVGLRTETRDFSQVARRPLRLGLAGLMNLVVAPALVVGVTRAADLAPDIAVGLIICGASPGGATGPLFAGAAGGHLATAIVAMIALSLLSVFTAPPTISGALGMAVDIDTSHLLVPMMGTLVVFQLLPLVLGMAVRNRNHEFAERVSDPANAIANVLLLAVIVGLLASKGAMLLEIGVDVVLICVGLVLVNLALGALCSRDRQARRSLSMVTGVRNVSLALLISAAYFPAPLTDATILTFGLFTMVIPFGIARVVARIPVPG